ncbi:MAG: hypothetical protein ABSD32_06775, partial [Mycobacterium sp.]
NHAAAAGLHDEASSAASHDNTAAADSVADHDDDVAASAAPAPADNAASAAADAHNDGADGDAVDPRSAATAADTDSRSGESGSAVSGWWELPESVPASRRLADALS